MSPKADLSHNKLTVYLTICNTTFELQIPDGNAEEKKSENSTVHQNG